MIKPTKFVVVGSGNVATHFAKALHSNAYTVLQVVSRNLNSAKDLAAQINSEYTDNLNDVRLDADYYLYAVSDNALENIIAKNIAPQAVHIHTAGSISIEVFKDKKHKFGVIYPLQTLSKDKELDFRSKVPLFVEASDEEVLENLMSIAESLSDKVKAVNSTQRLSLHLSAVFACNFTNFFYGIAENILKEKSVDFEYLFPLIQETADKITKLAPSEAQTGPARRNDTVTMEKHTKQLENNQEYKSLYEIVSKYIAQAYTKK